MIDVIITRSAAIERGLSRYFTGKPCKRGHVAERYVVWGSCFQCAQTQRKQWRASNPEKSHASLQAYKARNPEKCSRAIAAWCRANPDKLRKYQAKYHAANAEARRAKARRWREENRDKARIIWRNRRAREVAAAGSHSLLDVAEIAQAQRHRCAYCRTGLVKNKPNVDHIQPLARGGSNDRKNLQLLCAPCNLKKRAKDPLAFAREIGRLC